MLRSSDDGFILLLERCRPGHDLWDAAIDKQIEVMVDLLPRLWSTPATEDPYQELGETAARWAEQVPRKVAAMGLSAALADRARRWAQELRDDQPRRLLHGDFHPGNVLAAERRPWLAIDPKPWIGDPAFDLAQTLYNWLHADLDTGLGPADSMRLRARQLADGLSLDVDRVLRWAVVKAIGWDFGRDELLVLDEAARSP